MFSYGSAGRRIALPGTLTLPNGATITTSYDFMARLTNTTQRSSQQAVLNYHGYGHNAASQRTSVTNLAGNTVGYAYDRIGQLIQASSKEPGGTTRLNEQFGYGYDAAGNLALRTNDFAAAEPLVQTFSITNALHQLTSVTRSVKLTVAGTTTTNATSVTVNGEEASWYGDATFAKDGFTLTNGVNSFTAVAQDALGRLDTNAVTVNLPATVNFTYDDNGNLLSDGRRLLGYDDENQLITVIVTNGVNNSTLSKFAYDGFGRRRVRTECVWQNGGWATNALVQYVYDGMLVLQERDGNNLPTVTYTRGRDLSGSLQGAGGIGGLLSRTDQTTPTWSHAYYQADGNGNVTCLINEKQAVVARYVYDPFGNVLSLSGPLAEVNLYRFSSKEAHPVTGLVYYGFRFYDPNLQRWPNRDPLVEEYDINLYRYVYNSPLNYVDPDGLWGIQFGDFNIGWGDPNLAFDWDSWNDLGQGAAATADGLIPFFDPFKDKYDPCDPILAWSYAGGEIAQNALLTAAGLRAASWLGGTRLGHGLNHNPYLRIGPGRMPRKGPFPPSTGAPRISIGPQRPGVPNPHIDLRIRPFDP